MDLVLSLLSPNGNTILQTEPYRRLLVTLLPKTTLLPVTVFHSCVATMEMDYHNHYNGLPGV